MSNIVIIGASAGGLAAANKLRDLDPTAAITCLTKETTMPYNRCLLADFVSGSKSKEQIFTRDHQFFADKNIDLKLGANVVQLDAVGQKIILKDGTMMSYDSLVIATGRSAFVPDQLALQSPGIFPFYDLDHASDLVTYCTQNKVKRAVVVGGGITGLECSDALLQSGIQVVIVERGSQILARQMDVEGAQFLQSLMQQQGITLHLNSTVTTITSTSTNPAAPVYQVLLSNGQSIETEMIIAATGGKQNIHFAQAAGIACDKFGIITDESQATNYPNIYAAGDICSITNLASGQRTVSTLWPDAVAQGITVAHSISGLNKPYYGTLNITSTHIFKTALVTCGDFTASENLDTLKKVTPEFYHRFYLHDGILQSFVMIGNVSNVGQLRKAIIEKTKIN